MKSLIAAWSVVATAVALSSAAAQWPKHPAPGVPRTSDGKPDLRAPAPRTDDREGQSANHGRFGNDRVHMQREPAILEAQGVGEIALTIAQKLEEPFGPRRLRELSHAGAPDLTSNMVAHDRRQQPLRVGCSHPLRRAPTSTESRIPASRQSRRRSRRIPPPVRCPFRRW